MASRFTTNRRIRRASLLLPVVSTLLLIAVAPRHAQWSTYAAFVAVAIGTAAVGLSTWRHAQPVASLRQELYDINHPAAAGGKGSSWQQWLAGRDRSDARGRAQASFALSVAITAVIVYAWFV
jgi:hypothetical protein